MADNAEHAEHEDANRHELASNVAATSKLVAALQDSIDRARHARPPKDMAEAAREAARRVELAAELAALGAAVRELAENAMPRETTHAAGSAAEAATATGDSDAGHIGPLTDEDWSAARKALGTGSRSILFGTSDKVIDAAVHRLSRASRSRPRPAPGMA